LKKIKIFAIVFLITMFTSSLFGEENNITSKNLRMNVLDVTLLGSGLFTSINYSRVITVKSKYFVMGSLGIGSVIMIGGVSVPHQITLNYGTGSNFLEIGLGGCYWQGKSNASGYQDTISSYILTPIIGWRKNFQIGAVLRVYLSPLVSVDGGPAIENFPVFPYGGLSIGWGF